MKSLPLWLGAGAMLAVVQAVSIPAASAQTQTQAPRYGALDPVAARANTQGYVSLHLGNAAFDIDCLPGSTCDDKTTAGKIAFGSMRSDVMGLELAYLNFGSAQAGASGQKAQGLNVSLVLQQAFDSGLLLFGRVGTTYGYTDTDASLPGDATGSEQGFGLSYGVGVGYAIGDNLDVTLEAERHNFDFVTGDQDLDLLTLGLRLKF